MNPLGKSILRLGENVWRMERAEALAFLVDGQDYFRHLARTLPLARRSICIVGWDFDPDIKLCPPKSEETLGALLRRLVDQHPELEIHILVWAMGPLYSGRSLKLYKHNTWADHPRVHLRFDSRHALRGAHHQKMVTIDDATAFAGGIDLTAGRWDTSDHHAHCALRVKPNGQVYGPVHDLQTMFSGPAARAIAELIGRRWKQATGQELPLTHRVTAPWPDDCSPQMRDCMVAIARATPSLLGLKAKGETIQLTHDAIAAARRHIYIETQYLSSFGVGKALSARLREPDGPEIVIVVTSSTRGIIEQFVMAHNRDRLIRRLKKADRFDRLRVMYAVVPDKDESECEVLVHSKVVVVDDALLRVGSSNLANRSEGLDTECDIAVEAASAAEKRAVLGLRNRLLAEHLDASPEAIAAAIGTDGSMIATLERFNQQPRGLRPFNVDPRGGGSSPLPGTSLLDPKKPYWPLQKLRALFTSISAKLFGGLF